MYSPGGLGRPRLDAARRSLLVAMPVLLTLARSTLAMDPDLSEKLVGPRPWIGCTLRGSGWHGRVGEAPALLGRGSAAPPGVAAGTARAALGCGLT